MSNGTGDEYEEVVYYWDEDTQLYYYWDDSYQAYVAWVEDEGANENATEGATSEIATETYEAAADPDGASTDLTVSSLAPEQSVADKQPSSSNDAKSQQGTSLSPAPPINALSPAALMSDEMVVEKAEEASEESDSEALRDLEAEARRGSNRQNTVRRLTRKLTVTGKGQKSLAEQLALVAKARKNAGNLLTDEEMIRQQKERVLRRMAREQAGLPPEDDYDDDDDDDDRDSRSSSSASSSPPPPLPPKRSTTYQRSQFGGRRETARFGTAHFKDSKIGNQLEALLSRKVK